MSDPPPIWPYTLMHPPSGFTTPRRDSLLGRPASRRSVEANPETPDTCHSGLPDRFIPKRNSPLSQELFKVRKPNRFSPADFAELDKQGREKQLFNSFLEHSLFGGFWEGGGPGQPQPKRRLLNFGPGEADGGLSEGARLDRLLREARKLPQSPYRVLDAPGVVDDFYKVCSPEHPRLVCARLRGHRP